MGHIYTNIEVIGLKGKTRLKNILVDTGATYTVLEPSIVKMINASRVPPKMTLELGNGKKVMAQPYALTIKINSHQGPAIALSFPNAKNVIGVETLEGLGLNINLPKKRLEKTRPAGLAYFY